MYSRNKAGSEGVADSVLKGVRESGSNGYVLDVDAVISGGPLVCDLLVVIGGDGTILRTIHHLEDPETSILPISYGRGGYIATVEHKDAVEAVKRFLSGAYYLERRVRISVELNGTRIGDAVNELYVSNVHPGKTIEHDLSIDRLRVGGIVSDGVIVATPLGSTAYSLSAGGPAVDDALECFVVTPVCPITNIRPFVIPTTKTVQIDVRNSEFSVLIDGYVRRASRDGSVVARRSEREAVFVRVNEVNLFERRLRKRSVIS